MVISWKYNKHFYKINFVFQQKKNNLLKSKLKINLKRELRVKHFYVLTF